MHKSTIKIISLLLCLALTGPTAIRPAAKTGISCLAPQMNGEKQTEEEILAQRLLLHLARPELAKAEPKTVGQWLKTYGGTVLMDITVLFGTVVFVLAKTIVQSVLTNHRRELTRNERETRLKALIAKAAAPKTADEEAALREELRRAAPEIAAYIEKYLVPLKPLSYLPQEYIRFYNRIIMLDLWNRFPEIFANQISEADEPSGTGNPRALERLMNDWDAKLDLDIGLCARQLQHGPFMAGAIRAIAENILRQRPGAASKNSKSIDALAGFYAGVVQIYYLQVYRLSVPSEYHPSRAEAFRKTYAALSRRGYNLRTIMHNLNIAQERRYSYAVSLGNVSFINETVFLESFMHDFMPGPEGRGAKLSGTDANILLRRCLDGDISAAELRREAAGIEDFIARAAADEPIGVLDFDDIRLFDLMTLMDFWNKFPEMFGYDFGFFRTCLREREKLVRLSLGRGLDKEQAPGEYNSESLHAQLAAAGDNRAVFLRAARENAAAVINLRVTADRPEPETEAEAVRRRNIEIFYAALAMRCYADSYHWKTAAPKRPEKTVEAPTAGEFAAWLVARAGQDRYMTFRAFNSKNTLARLDEMLEKPVYSMNDISLDPLATTIDILLLSAA